MRRRLTKLTILGAVVAAPALSYTAQSPAAATQATSHTVKVGDFFFSPKTLHVSRDTTVTWRWTGMLGHNVTFSSLGKHSRTQTTGSYRLRFNRRGTFHYLCTIHHFTGTIVVR